MNPIDIAQQHYDMLLPDDDEEWPQDDDFDEPDVEPDDEAAFERSP